MNDVQDKPTSTPSAFPLVPTIKILGIGHFPVPLTAEQRKALGHKEVSDTVRMYLEGKIDQWWYRQDRQGVVFLMHVDEAKQLLDSRPFAHANLLKFDLMPLGALGSSPRAPRRFFKRRGTKEESMTKAQESQNRPPTNVAFATDKVQLAFIDGRAIAIITLNDPKLGNPMSPEMGDAFSAVVAQLKQLDDLRAVNREMSAWVE